MSWLSCHHTHSTTAVGERWANSACAPGRLPAAAVHTQHAPKSPPRAATVLCGCGASRWQWVSGAVRGGGGAPKGLWVVFR
jgi:hypothetical protein